MLGKKKFTEYRQFIPLKCFIDSNSYFQNDFCPQVVNYYKELFKKENYQEAFKKYFIAVDCEKLEEISHFNKVKHFASVNPALKQYIFKSIPPEFNLLEKSIYIYAKLCQILEYDNIHYLNDKSNNHIDEYNISNYDLENNKVVCYTFSYILSDLLREIGVENIKESQLIDNKFKNQHAFIEYLIDDIAIMADSTHKGVEEGDLSKFKFLNELKEIRCSMFDLNKQNEFKNAKNKILKYLEHEDMQKKDFFPSDEEIAKMNDLEKIVSFNNCINSVHLYGINLLAYAQELKKKLNCNISINYSVGTNPTEDIILNIRINPYSLKEKAYKSFDITYKIDAYTKEIIETNQRDDLHSIHR